MAQWVNRLRNNIFVNPPPLPLLCEFWSPATPSTTGSYVLDSSIGQDGTESNNSNPNHNPLTLTLTISNNGNT